MHYLNPDLGYTELDEEAIEDEVFGHTIRFCGYRHLIAMKEAAGPPGDIDDIARLRAARGER